MAIFWKRTSKTEQPKGAKSGESSSKPSGQRRRPLPLTIDTTGA